MKVLSEAIRKDALFLLLIKLMIGLGGLVTSILFHELVHVAIHWGNIQSISFFSNEHSIVEIVAVAPVGYPVALEELLAYSVSGAVIVATAVYMRAFADKKSTKTFRQSLLPRWSSLHELSSQELIEIAHRTKAFDSLL
jgi:hypothetical protein